MEKDDEGAMERRCVGERDRARGDGEGDGEGRWTRAMESVLEKEQGKKGEGRWRRAMEARWRERRGERAVEDFEVTCTARRGSKRTRCGKLRRQESTKRA